ncbi:MOSC domain-containing protein [Metabacillus sp. KIGAM252]|uniref:MOSC domain-containing protein n=1 Tax=Metabacillus flavus TaxID=2823519 RepID=A0ABS5LCQ1_9BACI|nr:MOSC domain-containing protein [Metabacillus flavus]MBS2968518.1 MOSC domain-containing protein [Metabacillus flavus]
MMKIEYLSKGMPKQMKDHKGKHFQSGINKETVNELEVSAGTVAGDDVANHDYHGGPDRVLCVYPFEHYQRWQSEFGKPLKQSAFGENLTVTGMQENEICIGDQIQIGSVLAEVSQGRYPCATINRHTGIDQLLAKIINTGYTGYFFRILKPGTIRKTDKIELVNRVTSITVADIHHTFFHNRKDTDAIQSILQIQTLADDWKKKFENLLERT